MFYCVLFCVLYRKESANKGYRNTVNNLISPNTVSQNDEKPHTAELDDTAIPHVKIKITEIPHEKKPNTATFSVTVHSGSPPFNKMFKFVTSRPPVHLIWLADVTVLLQVSNYTVRWRQNND